jgi:hypothetical protein
MLGLLALGAVMAVLTVRHCNRVADPILDFSLLRIVTYRTSVLGGTLFRIGIGAIPFLLPLMLQLGFGLSAIESGALTFVAALGCAVHEAGQRRDPAPPRLSPGAGGERGAGGGSLAVIGLFRPDTPHWVIYAVLFLGGCLRSIQFTSLNAIAFADLTPEQMSRATSLSSAAQQVSLGLGVTLGATAVAAAMSLRGGTTPVAADFPARLPGGGGGVSGVAAGLPRPARRCRRRHVGPPFPGRRLGAPAPIAPDGEHW